MLKNLITCLILVFFLLTSSYASSFNSEPNTDVLIITKGPNNPITPEKEEMNKTNDILQLRVISKESPEKIKKMTIIIPDGMVEFGEKLTNLSLFKDSDNDGRGDSLIVESFTTDSAISHTFSIDTELEADTNTYFTIRASLSLSDGDHMKIQVSEIEIESDRQILGLPVNSTEYVYYDDPSYMDSDIEAVVPDEDSQETDSETKSDGCATILI